MKVNNKRRIPYIYRSNETKHSRVIVFWQLIVSSVRPIDDILTDQSTTMSYTFALRIWSAKDAFIQDCFLQR